MSTEGDELAIQIEEEVDESSVPSSKQTKTSTAWELFEKFVDDIGLPKAKCKNCDKVYVARDGGGTSNLIKHAGNVLEEGMDLLIRHWIKKNIGNIFLRNWKLGKKVLSFIHCPPPHSGFNLAEKLISLLKEWGIERKVFTITLDNASNNDVMVNILKKHLLSGLGLRADYFHVRCGAHILNLIVHDGLKVIDGSLEKIRLCVKYIRGSEARKIKFVSCLQQLSNVTSKQVRQDCYIRWNSTYLMLDTVIGQQEAFVLLSDIDPHFDFCLSNEEWDEVKTIADFLKPFYDITVLFSGTSYPTANLYFSGVWRIQMKIKEVACVDHSDFEKQNQLCCMARRMRRKFDKYWNSYSVVLSFAVILDPRYKLQFVEWCYVRLLGGEGVHVAKMINDKLKAFFQEYLKPSNDASTSSSQRSIRGSPNIPSNDLQDFGTYESQLCGPSKDESDLDTYLNEKKLTMSNMLIWMFCNIGKQMRVNIPNFLNWHATF